MPIVRTRDGLKACRACFPLCWLLGTSVHKIRELRQYNRSHLLSCLHEKTHRPRNSRTGKPMLNEYITHTHISSTKQRRNIFSSSVEENGAGNAKTPSHLDTPILFRRIGFACSL